MNAAPTNVLRRRLLPLLTASVAATGLGIGALIRGAAHDHVLLGTAALLVALVALAVTAGAWLRVGAPAGAVRPVRAVRQAHERWLLLVETSAWAALLFALGGYLRAADAGEVDWPVRCGIVALAVIAQTAVLRDQAKRGEQPRLPLPVLRLPARGDGA